MTDKLKLLPREATPEMLKAMDECSMEGYDERLYEGHAGSVYMAAWDAFYGQHCYCGDITNLGVIHRDDGPCHYLEHTSEYKRGYADAMNWKVQNHLEHLPAAQPEQEPVGKLQEATAERAWFTIAELNAWADKKLSENPHWVMPKDEPERDEPPPQRTWVGLTDEDCFEALKAVDPEAKRLPLGFSMYAANIQAKLKEKNT